MQKIVFCFSIALNAYVFVFFSHSRVKMINCVRLCAGGMFTFPLMSPSLAVHLKLTQTQLTTIILAGMMSQYPIAVFVGWLIDQYGPSLCSFLAALMFVSGYTAFAWEVDAISSGVFQSSPTTFYHLSFYFLLIGLGTVFSYCSSLFSASKIFPSNIGLASGFSMALFGLSPLILSVLATSFFLDPMTGLLNVPAFANCLSVLSSVVYLGGCINFYRVPWPTPSATPVESSDLIGANFAESSPLLGPGRTEASITRPLNPTAIELLALLDFWLLAIFCICVLGMSEMIISSIGTIVLSLPPTSIESLPKQHSAAFQVKLISLANTISRIVVGPLADFISPLATRSSSGVSTFPRKHVISRFVFLSGAALLLICTLLWTKLYVYYQNQLWVLSVGTGLSYSTVFTVLLISSLWGIQDLGRNFGVMMYAPFTGTPLFSYVYALVSVSHTNNGAGVCEGRSCWDLTMSLCVIACIISLVLSFVLWKRWRGII
ncbi:major facilitator superfamily domain-containing protein [Gymnopilus junonius]|uniref:Major facilitator superfamily domain-containing protein n=1 Tax=Gymnopilus junonius TaxID=109634 RepID=A0A9P5NS03_GYMJU|nr:major facilitator superfamily domain-containing protein [Gymnopilus junonius]